MAPLPDNNTQRYWLDYTTAAGPRSVQFRVDIATLPEVITALNAYLDILLPKTYSSVTYNSLRYSSAGSDFSFPQVWAPRSGSAIGTMPTNAGPRFIQWVGRDALGRRVRLSAYGTEVTPDDNYRSTPAEVPLVLSMLNYLKSVSCPFVTISGERPVWNNYANTGYNVYHQRRERRT